MAKRKCKGKTKAGKPCRAVPLKKGTELEGVKVSGKWCRQHDQDLPDSARIGGAQPGAGRPRNPRVVDVMRERVESEIEAILKPYFDTLKEATEVAKYEGVVYTSEVPDLRARVEAAEKLLDRVYGKPTQVAEISAPGGAPLLGELFADDKVREGLHGLKRAVAAARGERSGRAGTGD